MGAPESLLSDPRTMWATRVYDASEQFPSLGEWAAGTILGWLGDFEHVEAIARARWVPGGNMISAGGDYEDAPTLPCVRTMTRWLFLDENLQATSVWDDQSATSTTRKYGHGVSVVGTRGAAIVIFDGGNPSIDGYLFKGAADSIMRLPELPGVPPVPDLLAPSAAGEGPRPPVVPTGWQGLEDLARRHAISVGFGDATLTAAGADGGVDLVGRDMAAQVKMLAQPVGRPQVQQLTGAAGGVEHRLFYSSSGFSSQAVEYATQSGVALFGVGQDGSVAPVNDMAGRLLRTGPGGQAATGWARAYEYRDQVIERLQGIDKDDLGETLRFSKLLGPSTPARAQGYKHRARTMLRDQPRTDDPLAFVRHYHHAELCAAVWARTLGVMVWPPVELLNPVQPSAESINDYY